MKLTTDTIVKMKPPKKYDAAVYEKESMSNFSVKYFTNTVLVHRIIVESTANDTGMIGDTTSSGFTFSIISYVFENTSRRAHVTSMIIPAT